MCRNKYDQFVLPRLADIEDMAGRGVTIKDISAACGVDYKTFRRYLDRGLSGEDKYVPVWDAFVRGSTQANEMVENALHKRACGYDVEELTVEEKVTRDGDIVTVKKVQQRHIPGDVAAMEFWLLNRAREDWKPKQAVLPAQDEDDGTGVVALPAVAAAAAPPPISAAGLTASEAQQQQEKQQKGGGADGGGGSSEIPTIG